MKGGGGSEGGRAVKGTVFAFSPDNNFLVYLI